MVLTVYTGLIMNRNEVWKIYGCIIDALSSYNIDTGHDSTCNSKTQFYFRDYCGGDIIDKALTLYNFK